MKIRKRRPIIAFILLIILLAGFYFLLEIFGLEVVNKAVQDRNEQKFAGITQKLQEVDKEIRDIEDTWFDKKRYSCKYDGSLFTLPDRRRKL